MATLKSYNLNSNEMTLTSSDSINAKSLNPIIDQFINNDLHVYGQYDKIPGFWKCRWYNDESIPGYSKGDFFWLNTENVMMFMQNRWREIQKYANENPFVLSNLPDWRANDEIVYNQYYNVLTGYMDPTKSKPLQALYEIGDLSAPAQLIISLKDNNKESISNKDYWKRVLVNTDEDYDNMIEMIYKTIPDVMEDHIKNYHFGNETFNPEISKTLSLYVDEDFQNIDKTYAKNFIRNDEHSKGFDIVEHFIYKPIYRSNANGVIENKWFRLWKSGYLEHGGVIDTYNHLNYKLSTRVIIPFNWTFVDDNSKMYDVKYLAKDPLTFLKIDESKEVPPGDDYISVLYELDNLIVNNSDSAPYYANTLYVPKLTPIQSLNLSSMIPEMSYAGIGSNSILNNVIDESLEIDEMTLTSMSFKFNKLSTPRYYSYYVTGFYYK